MGSPDRTPVGHFGKGVSPTRGAALPYHISSLLYCFSSDDRVLLMERRKEPNLGLWSPCGGKLDTQIGESPHACACREAKEELGLSLTSSQLHLTGVVSESGYEGQAHWLMFLFEVRLRLSQPPPEHREGRFAFFDRGDLARLPLPRTDRERLWPWFWEHRGGFFAAHCACGADGAQAWRLESSRPASQPWRT
jgi:8-oxo-dGTP diphosphatase